MTEPIDTEPENYLDLRPNGGMHIVVEGVKRRMRAPRMRDYRMLYDLWRDEAESLDNRTVELQAFLARVMAEGDEREQRGEARISDEDRTLDRKYGQEIREATEDAAIRWWTRVITTLGVDEHDRAMDPDDLPVFMCTAESVTQALQHWRTVPSRSGAR